MVTIPSVAASLNPQVLGGSNYIFILILLIIEGPIVTYVAAFAASLGLLNVYILFALSVLGNILGDLLVYSIGRFGKKAILNKYFKKKRLKHPIIKKIEHNMKTHTGKTLLFVKTVPPFPIPGIMMSGLSEVPIKKFLLYSIPISIGVSLLFLIAGFYTGEAYLAFIRVFKRIELAVSATILLVIIGWMLFRYLERKLKNLEVKKFRMASVMKEERY